MRLLRPAETIGLTDRSPLVWWGEGDNASFVYDVPANEEPFICFFLKADPELAAPKLVFDEGEGFNDVSAIALQSFAFGFYHVSLATMASVRRIRFRPCDKEATFKFLAFRTGHSVLVAVLHYLFNLRYQHIGLVTGAPRGLRGIWPTLTSNAARVKKFFSDVSVGGGVRVQQAEDNILARLLLAQSEKVASVRVDVKSRLEGLRDAPLISFVAPTYNTSKTYLQDLLSSYVSEDAPYSELILSDDGSKSTVTNQALAHAEALPGVRVLRAASNGGIAAATNAGIDAARGEWVAFIDHDDAFMPGAIAVIVQAILDNPDGTFFYTDEVITNTALKPIGSFCKPTYDSVLLSGLNFINHFSVFRRERLASLGGLRLDREGSQDYDLLLRYLNAARPGSVIHIPFLAYSWRRAEQSYSAVHRSRSIGNARKALEAAYQAAGRKVSVDPAHHDDLHRVRFVRASEPLISVVIANKNSAALIKRVVSDLRSRTSYANIEIIIADNGTDDPNVLRFYDQNGGERFRVDLVAEDFNFARMCNRGAALAKGEALLFLNNDIEVSEAEWLDEMIECLSFAETGIVGAKLLYPNGKIQHAGVIVGLGEAAGHWYVEEASDEPGPQGRLAVRQTMTAVTGACMLVTKRCFEALGGFDEEVFPIAYNDIDFCIRARQAGFRTVWTPFATLVHHESVSRGSDESGENNVRFRKEFAALQERHGTKTCVDEAFSPFYDRRYSRPHLSLPAELPKPRRNSLA